MHINPSWDKNVPEVFLVCFSQHHIMWKRRRQIWERLDRPQGPVLHWISSEHVGAARADAPGVIVLIQERVLRKVCVLTTEGMVTWDSPARFWYKLGRLDRSRGHCSWHRPLAGRPTLPTCHGALHWMFRKGEKGYSASCSGQNLAGGLRCRRICLHWVRLGFSSLGQEGHLGREWPPTQYLPENPMNRVSLRAGSPWGYKDRHDWVTQHLHHIPVSLSSHHVISWRMPVVDIQNTPLISHSHHLAITPGPGHTTFPARTTFVWPFSWGPVCNLDAFTHNPSSHPQIC